MTDYWRQMDVFDPYRFEGGVTVIGAGGIGSPAVLGLAKMGVKDIKVYDPDTVELHNIPNQFYRLDDVGSPKITALASIIKAYAGTDIEAVQGRFAGHPSGIVISAVDSMDSRKEIWDLIKYKTSIPLYIDARMGAEVGIVHTLRPTSPIDVAWYEGTLFSDEDSVPEPCTARAIIYNVLGIAAIIGGQVKRYSRGEELPKEIIVDFATYSLLVG